MLEIYPETMVKRMFIEQEAKDKLIDKVKIKYVDSAELEDTDAETNADTTEDATEDTSGEE